MAEKDTGNVKEIVKSMRETGASDEEIEKNLEQMGLEPEEIESILQETESEEKPDQGGSGEEDDEVEEKMKSISKNLENVNGDIDDIETGEDLEEKMSEVQGTAEEQKTKLTSMEKQIDKISKFVENFKEDNEVSNKEIYEEVREAKNKISALTDIEQKALDTNKKILMELKSKKNKKD